MWDYQLLEVLDAIVTNGSFGAAARSLHLTQSAVSQRLKTLEEELGGRLLIRGKPPVPTALGQKLLQHSKRVRVLEQELALSLDQDCSTSFYTVTLGVNGDSLATWFFPAVKEVLAKEGLLADLIIENESVTFERLRRGEVLGCISSRAARLAGCTVEKLGTMKYRCSATPQFAASYFKDGFTVESVPNTPAIIYDAYDTMHAQFLERMFKSGNLQFPFHKIANSHGFLECIRSGLAYGLAPVLQAQADYADGTLIDLVPGKTWNQDLFWHHQRSVDKQLKRLSDTIVKSARKRLKAQR